MIALDPNSGLASPPAVAELLDVDREYRARAAAADLPTIAPRRDDAAEERWLPILHTIRGDRRYTALYSTSASARQLGRTFDWVVIHVEGRDGEQRYTVVTERKGLLARRRVVRGREVECARHYRLPRHRAPIRRGETARALSAARRVANHGRGRANGDDAGASRLDAANRDAQLHDDLAVPDFLGAGTE